LVKTESKSSNNKTTKSTVNKNGIKLEDYPIPTATDINNSIDRRYADLDDKNKKISLAESEEIAKKLVNENTPNDTSILVSSSEFPLKENEIDYFSDNSFSLALLILGGIFSIPLILWFYKYLTSDPNTNSNFLPKIFNFSLRNSISDSVLFLHNRAFDKVEELANKAQSIDNEKFGNDEFSLFLKIKTSIKQGIGEYKGLSQSAKMLEVAVAAQTNFIALEQTEFRFRSRTQQQFYDYISKLLAQNSSSNEFKDKVQKKFNELLPLLRSDEGRVALEAYIRDLHKISEHELGLKLLSLFKEYNLNDYSILKTISDLLERMEGQDTIDLKALSAVVMYNYEVFEKLGQIVGLSGTKSNPDNYAKLLQYIALARRYQISYPKFEEMLGFLQEWVKPYQSLIAIRHEYNNGNYNLPKDFYRPVPGINLYEKYKSHLIEKSSLGLIA
jgi:hypothetical protein